MKNSVLNLVKGGVFLLAMIAAFAFTTPMEEVETAWGIVNPITGETEEVTVGSNEYECDVEISETCLYQDEAATMPLPDYPEGRFSLNP
ncbi:hypothetical protein [Echinicola shivajiensis]|uniref:hypothetical protein n=1 Tax=Echinicola shivajiensis TaxID=1035916 RepID=UPI001BFCBB92|nr:hypothetical protein [Echinicola shivajiensis]